MMMAIKPVFYEAYDFEPNVQSIDEFISSISSNTVNIYIISEEIVRFVKDLLKMKPVIQLKHCRFSFNNGEHFVEIDGKGNIKNYEAGSIPDWYETPIEITRSQWINNNDFSYLIKSEFLSAFIKKFPDVNERREYADMLLDLHLNKVEVLNPITAHKNRGNTSGRTTKSKVTELQSFELFCQFFERMKNAVYANIFPTLKVLLAHDNLNEIPTPMKGAVRTWFKGITGQLPPNNKRVVAGNVELFCAPIREKLVYIEEIGLEIFYRDLSKAIADSKDMLVSNFHYDYTKKTI